MLQRVLIATAVLAVTAGTMGCKKKADPDKKAQQGGKVPAWESLKDATPTGAGRTQLERIGVHCRQLDAMSKRKPMPYSSLESLGWTISKQAKELVAAYEFARREKALEDESKLGKLKEDEAPDASWAKWPDGIKDLDLVASNAKALALAAGTLNRAEIRTRLEKLRKVAGRCLPQPSAPAEDAPVPAK